MNLQTEVKRLEKMIHDSGLTNRLREKELAGVFSKLISPEHNAREVVKELSKLIG